MKKQLAFLFTAIGFGLAAQTDVKITEEQQIFSVGSKNSIVVTIPYVKKEFVDKELKSELKSWKGKYSFSAGEHVSSQASLKVMGEKPFDAYARTFLSGDEIKITVAIDLGGSYMTSAEHSAQYNAMVNQLNAFAQRTIAGSYKEDLKAEKKMLVALEKEQKNVQKQNEKLQKSIDDYKKKIFEAESQMSKNAAAESEKKAAVEAQKAKVTRIEKKTGM